MGDEHHSPYLIIFTTYSACLRSAPGSSDRIWHEKPCVSTYRPWPLTDTEKRRSKRHPGLSNLRLRSYSLVISTRPSTPLSDIIPSSLRLSTGEPSSGCWGICWSEWAT